MIWRQPPVTPVGMIFWKPSPLRLQNRLSPLLRALTFMPNKRATALLKAVDHFKNDWELSASHVPMGFLDADQRTAVVRR